MRRSNRGARPGAQSGTGPPEGSGQRQVKTWAARGCGGDGRRRAAPPREGVAAPPARARWVPRPRRPSRRPRAGSRAWSASLSSGSSAKGGRHPAAGRPAGRWKPDSPRPLGGGGEAGLEPTSLCRAAPGPQQPPAPAATPWLLTALRHVLQARHKGGEVGIVSVLLLGRGLQVRGALSGRASKGGTLRGSRGDCKWLPVAGRPLAGPILPQNPLNPTNPMHSPYSPAPRLDRPTLLPLQSTRIHRAPLSLPHRQQHRQHSQPIRVTSSLLQALVPRVHVDTCIWRGTDHERYQLPLPRGSPTTLPHAQAHLHGAALPI